MNYFKFKLIIPIILAIIACVNSRKSVYSVTEYKDMLCDSLVIVFESDRMVSFLVEDWISLKDLVHRNSARQIMLYDKDTIQAFQSRIDSMFNYGQRPQTWDGFIPSANYAIFFFKDGQLVDSPIFFDDNPSGMFQRGEDLRKDSLLYNAVINVIYDRYTKYQSLNETLFPKAHSKHEGTCIEKGVIFHDN